MLGLPPPAVYLVIGALAAVENVFPPIPADTAVALGAFLSAGSPISAWTVFWITWIANVTSATLVYVAARRLGRPFFTGRLGRRLLRPTAMTRLESMYGTHGTWGIFASRFIPGVRAVVPPFAGVAGLGALRALVPVYVASGIWYGGLTFLAATAVRSVDDVARLVAGINRGAAAFGMALAIGLLSWWIVRRRRRTDAIR